MNDEEKEALAHLSRVAQIIEGWSEREDGWYANQMQLIMGIHLIQQFIVQHMMLREMPELNFANWWADPTKEATPDADGKDDAGEVSEPAVP